jgi:oxalate---CoA ligase
VASARSIAAGLALTPTDRCLNVMPLFHIHGLVGALLATLSAGGSVVAAPGFVAPEFYGWLDAFGPTWYTAVPTIHQAVLARAERHQDVIERHPLRFIRSSSAALPVSTAEGLEAAFGAPVIEAYGMTEASHQMASNPLPPGVRKPGSVGVAAGIEIAVLDADGSPVPEGSLGEVGIRGATVIDGYEANPEADARAFVNGWFLTGDQGVLDADGYLHLRGRLKELINRAGEKIAPVEVEEVLLTHPAVRQAVVFAVPDARVGEAVAAAVVATDGVAPAERELQAFVAARLADHKVPVTIRVVDEIPKGATGKVQRIGMAERLGMAAEPGASGGASVPAGDRATAAEPAVAPRTALETDLAAIWAEVLGLERIGVRDDFFALGGDSMLAAMIVTRVGERLGHRDLPLATFLWAPTVERYAHGLQTGSWDVPTSPLLPIQPEGDRPPFFFVHIDDTIIGPAAIRRSLDPDQPVYGLRAMGIDGVNLPPSIDGLAHAFIDEVRTIQPVGPYYLGGYCSGGRVALEMARRLRAEGESVAMLGLVDPRIDRRRDVRSVLRSSVRLAGRLPHHLRHRQLRRATVGLGRQLAIRLSKPPEDGPMDRYRYLDALARARRAQTLTRYPGAITVFHSRQYEIPRAFWDGIADRVDWEPLAVDHETVFQGDQGALFATRLCEALRDAERAAEPASA